MSLLDCSGSERRFNPDSDADKIFPGLCKYQVQLVPTCWAGIFLDFFFPFHLLSNVRFVLSRQDTACARACMAGDTLSMVPLAGPPAASRHRNHLFLLQAHGLNSTPQPTQGTKLLFYCSCAGGVPPRANMGHTMWNGWPRAGNLTLLLTTSLTCWAREGRRWCRGSLPSFPSPQCCMAAVTWGMLSE